MDRARKQPGEQFEKAGELLSKFRLRSEQSVGKNTKKTNFIELTQAKKSKK